MGLSAISLARFLLSPIGEVFTGMYAIAVGLKYLLLKDKDRTAETLDLFLFLEEDR